MARHSQNPLIRFWSKVEKTHYCWNWTSTLNRGGYGKFRVSSNVITTAHRYLYFLTNGDIPRGICVLHKCDNRRCVNPDHLFLGTTQENTQDRVNKGRSASGPRMIRKHIADKMKLTAKDVKRIRESYATKNITQQKLAEEYKVRQDHISRIVNHKNWRYI